MGKETKVHSMSEKERGVRTRRKHPKLRKNELVKLLSNSYFIMDWPSTSKHELLELFYENRIAPRHDEERYAAFVASQAAKGQIVSTSDPSMSFTEDNMLQWIECSVLCEAINSLALLKFNKLLFGNRKIEVRPPVKLWLFYSAAVFDPNGYCGIHLGLSMNFKEITNYCEAISELHRLEMKRLVDATGPTISFEKLCRMVQSLIVAARKYSSAKMLAIKAFSKVGMEGTYKDLIKAAKELDLNDVKVKASKCTALGSKYISLLKSFSIQIYCSQEELLPPTMLSPEVICQSLYEIMRSLFFLTAVTPVSYPSLDTFIFVIDQLSIKHSVCVRNHLRQFAEARRAFKYAPHDVCPPYELLSMRNKEAEARNVMFCFRNVNRMVNELELDDNSVTTADSRSKALSIDTEAILGEKIEVSSGQIPLQNTKKSADFYNEFLAEYGLLVAQDNREEDANIDLEEELRGVYGFNYF